MATVKHAYVGRNIDTEEKEMRIVLVNPDKTEQDLFFGVGTDEDGEALTIEEAKQTLKDDKNWRDRVVVIQRTSKKGSEYSMAILSNLVVDEVLDF
jgi:hypothetical protein